MFCNGGKGAVLLARRKHEFLGHPFEHRTEVVVVNVYRVARRCGIKSMHLQAVARLMFARNSSCDGEDASWYTKDRDRSEAVDRVTTSVPQKQRQYILPADGRTIVYEYKWLHNLKYILTR